MQFGWDEGKRRWLLADRAIDFRDITEMFDGRTCFTDTSYRNGEERFVTIAEREGKMFAAVWMWRGDVVWLITARRAWKSEERSYRELIANGGRFDDRRH